MESRFLINEGRAREVFARYLARDATAAQLSWSYRVYYLLARPLLPLSVRQWMQGGRHIPANERWCFPDEFVDRLADELKSQTPPVIHPWPGAAEFALVLTHDVETAEGVRHMLRVADVEEKLGLRSSFNLVPYKYPIDMGIVAELTSRGFEIGVHGYNHDGKLYFSRRIFERRAAAINEALRRYGAVGFRSPMVHRNLDWLQLLEIEYDASCFDIDPYQAMPGGVGSLWPFTVGRFVELPYTMPQDHTLWIARSESGYATWEQKLQFIADRCGMALMLTHPDYMLSPRRLNAYASFLARVRETREPWTALPCEVARWWRERDASRVHPPRNHTWTIVGPAASRGVAALVRVADQRLVFELLGRQTYYPDNNFVKPDSPIIKGAGGAMTAERSRET